MKMEEKKMKKYKVYSNDRMITSFSSKREAEAYIRICERQDRYEVRMGYGFPNGLPVYEIRTK